MLRMRWLRSGRSARGTPSLRRMLRRHPFLLPLLTLVILSQAGCQSGVFGPCGPCANNPLRSLRERVFNRVGGRSCFGGGGNCGPVVGGSVISDVPMIEGAPTVVTPAPVMTPGAGAALPAPAEVAPQLDPLPSAAP